MAEKTEQGKSASYRYRERYRFAAEPIPAPDIVKKVANPGIGSAGKSVLLTMSSGSRFALFDFLSHSGASPHQISVPRLTAFHPLTSLGRFHTVPRV
jgi:hypothetical protein